MFGYLSRVYIKFVKYYTTSKLVTHVPNIPIKTLLEKGIKPLLVYSN